MRALVVFAHYFKAEPGAEYSSVNALRRDARRKSIEQVLLAWRAHFSATATLNVEQRKFELNDSSVTELDLGVIVNDDDHLLDDAFLERLGVQKFAVSMKNPRMLPFVAQRVMADRKSRYDWYVYSEEDLLLHDASLFAKLTAFQAAFGPKRVLMPNRYELNSAALRPKTYIDGDLRFGLVSRLLSLVNEHETQLAMPEAGVKFLRAHNPHAGFFALSAAQFDHWSSQKHFLDMDASFISPLESAATLGILKTFSVFKPALPMHHLEIEHLDTKFSNMQLPVLLRGEISPA